MVKIDKNREITGQNWKNEHKNEQICYCNLRLFTIYLGQNKEKDNIEGGIKA